MKNKILFATIIGYCFLSAIITGCTTADIKKENINPTIQITNPNNSDEIILGSSLTISANASDSDGEIAEVRFLIDHIGVFSVATYPYNFEWFTENETAGNHSIKVTALDNEGASASHEIKIYLIKESDGGQKPVAEFMVDKTSADKGVPVRFTDQSSYFPKAWEWDFGDGGSSEEQNPEYIYNTVGLFTVNLTVHNDYGFDTKTKTNYISIQASEVGDTGTVVDFEGNSYKTIRIGSQWWMAENLKATVFNEGSPIPHVADISAWDNLTSPAYTWYDNDELSYKDSYGPLYNWYAINMGNICPEGWHAPNGDEWNTLIDFVGGKNTAGSHLKETGTVHWESPNDDATNESGFTALPGGYLNYKGNFNNIRIFAYYWTSTEINNDAAWYQKLSNDKTDVKKLNGKKFNGFSVRCIKN